MYNWSVIFRCFAETSCVRLLPVLYFCSFPVLTSAESSSIVALCRCCIVQRRHPTASFISLCFMFERAIGNIAAEQGSCSGVRGVHQARFELCLVSTRNAKKVERQALRSAKGSEYLIVHRIIIHFVRTVLSLLRASQLPRPPYSAVFSCGPACPTVFLPLAVSCTHRTLSVSVRRERAHHTCKHIQRH